MPYAGDDPETVKNDQLAVIQDDEALQSLDAVLSLYFPQSVKINVWI